MSKEKNSAKQEEMAQVLESDAGFFEWLRQMERKNLMELGDMEAVAMVDAQWEKSKEEARAAIAAANAEEAAAAAAREAVSH